MTDENRVNYHIGCDWISYTKEVSPDADASDVSFRQKMLPLFFPLEDLLDRSAKDLLTVSDIEHGRPPYNKSIVFDFGARLYYNQNLTHALMEVSGIGCKHLRDYGVMELWIQFAYPRITRFDLAVDVDCDTKPIEIITEGISSRFKALSQITSDSGDTVYIGSRKSEKFLRVYRYNDPHPRSKMLRYEFVFKKKLAQPLVNSLITSEFDYVGIAQTCREQYGIESLQWPVRGDSVDLKMDYDQRTAGKTLQWLIASVAPAFRKLVHQGLIEDPEHFLITYFLEDE